MTGTVTDHGCVLRQEDIPWAGRQLWDCDVQEYETEVPTNAQEQAEGMGFSKKVKRYVMYFPLKDRNDVFHWGIAIADNPVYHLFHNQHLCLAATASTCALTAMMPMERLMYISVAFGADSCSDTKIIYILKRHTFLRVKKMLFQAVACVSPKMA